MQRVKKLLAFSYLSSLFFYLSIFIFIISFNFTDTPPPPSGWYQQWMPNLNGRSITDVFFLDSLTGWAVTNATNQNPDTTYVLKTTNSGDNWIIQYRKLQTGGGFSGYFRIYFLNQNTGYTCDVKEIDKTTNGGLNWESLNVPLTAYTDMSVLNTDTIWIVTPDNFSGGVFRTTNGGVNWQQQLNIGSQNPEHIYMFNGRIGFICRTNYYIRKTTNSGLNWSIIVNGKSFSDMFFIDSLKGWYAFDSVRTTTNGGSTWQTQILPYGGFIYSFSQLVKFGNVSSDTIWGVGGRINFPNNQTRGIIYKTTNGGNTWGFQLPDTNINIFKYLHNKFVNRLNGWAYGGPTGVHTTTGGDTITYSEIKQISIEIPKQFKLYQNYPNPFNPVTNLKLQITNSENRQKSNIKLNVYDITGRLILTLLDQTLDAGEYEIKFDGTNYTSGIYFYSMYADDVLIDTKKMILIK